MTNQTSDLYPFQVDYDYVNSNWLYGEWSMEPDHISFLDSASLPHLRCAIVRNSCGALCGYVKLPAGFQSLNEDQLKVHGGITYQNDGWIGFDCAHVDDFYPGLRLNLNKIYKNIWFVKTELKSLCAQIRVKLNSDSILTITDLGF